MFACPNCGGNLKFNISTQQLGCEHCQTQLDPYSFEDKEKDAIETNNYDVTIFTCPQCGGEILSTDTSAAEFCTFCGASTILYSRLSKEKRPDYIIPFQKTKEDCKNAYSNMMKKAIFAPDELKNPRHIDSFRGIYMPYWAFYMTQEGPFTLKGSKTKRRGDYIITDHYALHGEIDAYYKGLSYDASSSFDDNISQKIAPYDVKGMKKFTPAFLSGFYADTADVDASLYQTQAEALAYNNSIRSVYNQFSGISIQAPDSTMDLNTKTKTIDRAMFPVWFMSYRNGDRIAYTTINGQTGKVVTDLPIDTKKYLKGSLLLAIPLFILLNLFFTISPNIILIISAILAAISMIFLRYELSQIKKRDSLRTDRGGMVKQEPVKEKYKSAGTLTGIFAIIIAALILFINPINDIFYYGGVILVLAAIFITIKDLIFYYNIMATRRLPQFDRTGGDDRA
ncbi:MAG: zinc ribbon domain-containing protein [Agathobacter sp.]|nr:zinc ribbon domain-containing protein [Agathobacter sp.]